MNFLVRPDGWVIPEAASSIHGITQQAAERYGLSTKGVLSVFARLASMADYAVAHNIMFDLQMIALEIERNGIILDLPKKYACTMEESRDILKIPPTPKMVAAGFDKYKSPNLQESYRHFFGREFEGAHDAMADVRACRDVYFAIQKMRLAA